MLKVYQLDEPIDQIEKTWVIFVIWSLKSRNFENSREGHSEMSCLSLRQVSSGRSEMYAAENMIFPISCCWH